MIPALPRSPECCELSAAWLQTPEGRDWQRCFYWIPYSRRCPFLDLALLDYRRCAAMEET